MDKLTELNKNLEALKNEAQALKKQGKLEEAYNKIDEIKTLQVDISIAEAEQALTPSNDGGTNLSTVQAVDEMTVLNKVLLGKPLTAAENDLASSLLKESDETKGGYLVPKAQRTQIEEMKRQLIPLKPLCRVIPVNTRSGSMPIETSNRGKLTRFNEGEDMTLGTITFSQVTWTLEDIGEIIPVSNLLLQDEKANIMSFIKHRFAANATRTENADILDLLATATETTGTDYTGIVKALNTDLDPAHSATAIIITNQDGFNYLDTLTDENGRPLLTADLARPTGKMFKGRQLIVLSNADLPSPTASGGNSKYLFYVAAMDKFIAFFDREVYTIAASKEAGFVQNVTYIKVIERYDVVKLDAAAARKVTLTITPATAKAK